MLKLVNHIKNRIIVSRINDVLKEEQQIMSDYIKTKQELSMLLAEIA